MSGDAPEEPRVVRFLFDYVSSNAYLAWKQLLRMETEHGFATRPVPVLFAGLLEAHGQLGPAEVPAKAIWMWHNCLRKAVVLDLPLKTPPYHPFNPLLALRVSGLPMPEGERRTLVSALLDAVWAREVNVMDPDEVRRALDAAGLDGPALVAQAGEAEAKVRLRSETEAAVAGGVFGVPSMRFGERLFWGYDDLPWLERCLAGEDPLDRADTTLRRPQPGAQRRRFRAP